VIRTENLTRRFQLGETVTAVQDVSVSIDAGEFVAVSGPSGSGKSTFMSIIGCLDRPTSGRCWVDGEETSSLCSDDLAAIRNQKIGFVFQNFNLLDRLDARENIELPLMYAGVNKQSRREITEVALRMVGGPAFGRPAATSRSGQGARLFSEDHPRGRTHRGAGQQIVGGTDGLIPQAQRARQDDRCCYPRPRNCQAGIPGDPVP
jgi:ABC-type lipoprotein export system ATPase subunit